MNAEMIVNGIMQWAGVEEVIPLPGWFAVINTCVCEH
jgi:hypothetical protein